MWQKNAVAHRAERVGGAGVSQGVIRVLRYGLLEILQRNFRRGACRLRVALQSVASPEVKIIGFQVVGIVPLRGPELQPQSACYRTRDLLLNGKNVAHLPIVGTGPEVLAVRSADQLRGDPKLVSYPAHAPLQQDSDVELA